MNLRWALGSACLLYDQLSVTATQGVAHLRARLSLCFLIQFWALVQISDSARLSTQKTLGDLLASSHWVSTAVPASSCVVSSLAFLALFLLLPCRCCLRPSWPSSHRLRPSQSSSSRVSVASGPPSPLFCNRWSLTIMRPWDLHSLHLGHVSAAGFCLPTGSGAYLQQLPAPPSSSCLLVHPFSMVLPSSTDQSPLPQPPSSWWAPFIRVLPCRNLWFLLQDIYCVFLHFCLHLLSPFSLLAFYPVLQGSLTGIALPVMPQYLWFPALISSEAVQIWLEDCFL